MEGQREGIATPTIPSDGPSFIVGGGAAMSSSSGRSSPTTTAAAAAASPITGKFSKANEAQVDSFFDRARQGIHCTLFCGGVKCKHEDWNVYKERKNVHPAVEGLNSNWVGDAVVASQRPSTSLFLKYLLIQQFKQKSITGVFNLQEKGEHASCGPDGIYANTGYSYNGEMDLMRHGVSYYEFPWPDMTAPDNDIVLRSVQVMDSHIQQSGKVLVHCHAGLGRTGLLIACYLVYTSRMRSDDAVRLVRISRPGAVQTSTQVEFVRGFEKHLWDLQTAFRIEITDPRVELDLFMKRQRQLLHGDEGDRYKYIPKPLHFLLCRAISLSQEGQDIAQTSLESLAISAGPTRVVMQETCAKINRGELMVSALNDVKLLMFLSVDWFRSMSAPVVTAEMVKEIVEFMKREPNVAENTAALTELICRLCNRVMRHTIGLMVSATYIIAGQANASEALRRFAFKCISEALTHTHTPTKSYLSGFEAQLLSDFFYEWGHSVGAIYFDDTIVPEENRTIGLIAAASQRTLDSTSNANVLLRPRAESSEANDLHVDETEMEATTSSS